VLFMSSIETCRGWILEVLSVHDLVCGKRGEDLMCRKSSRRSRRMGRISESGKKTDIELQPVTLKTVYWGRRLVSESFTLVVVQVQANVVHEFEFNVQLAYFCR
jgi:hypothetical protein